MSKPIAGVVVSALIMLAVAGGAEARNDKYVLPIAAALEASDAGPKPDGSVKFFLPIRKPPISSRDWPAIRRINGAARGRTETKALVKPRSCPGDITTAGATNAVVDIVSFFKNDVTASKTEFQCRAGTAAHVMLRGDFVQIAG